jgi:hypothetical protein
MTSIALMEDVLLPNGTNVSISISSVISSEYSLMVGESLLGTVKF